ncbi:putative transposase-like protein [Trichonephila clavipes]|nr:putative transposase-like protein [Trichonephila clavipes]
MKSGFSSATLAAWRHFVHEKVLDHVELTSSKIGGVGKVVQVDESKFGKRKFHKGRHVEGQWVFGGVERDSGKQFFGGCSRSHSTNLNANHYGVDRARHNNYFGLLERL